MLQLLYRVLRCGDLRLVLNAAGIAPGALAAQVKQLSVDQFERDHSTGACQHLLTREYSVAFNEQPLCPFIGDCDNLADDGFDNCDSAAHDTSP